MRDFKSFTNTGLISKKDMAPDQDKLHELTTEIIMYRGGHYIEMLKNKYFLYRPTGVGRGKRSKELEIVEEYMYNQVSSKTLIYFIKFTANFFIPSLLKSFFSLP